MKALLIIGLLLSNLAFIQADDYGGKLGDIASAARIENGRLALTPYADMRLWLNGRAVDTGTSLVDPNPWPEIVMRPGDVLTYATGCYYSDREPASHRTFEQFRLDRLTDGQAEITLSTSSASVTELGGGRCRFCMGGVKTVVRFRAKDFAFLYEPPSPGVLLGNGRQWRSR